MSELGEALSAERRRAGRTIAEVEAATKIRGRLIEALEKGDTDRLPSPAYVKGYIQSYARYLEIPAEPLLEIYRRESGANLPAPEVHAPRPTPAVPRREDLHIIPMRTAFVIVGVIAAAALAVWGIATLIAPHEDTGPAPLPVSPSESTASPSITSPTATTGVTTATPGVVPDASGELSSTDSVPTGAEFEIKVTVKRGEACWVIVQVDGLHAYEGMMTDGESKTWLVKSEASIGMGRPTAVEITRDGTPVTDKAQLVGKVPTVYIYAEQ